MRALLLLKEAITTDELHDVTRIKRQALERKLGRDVLMRRDGFRFGFKSNDQFTEGQLLGPTVVTNPTLKNHPLGFTIFAENKSYKTLHPEGIKGKSYKAANSLLLNHELDEMYSAMKGHTVPLISNTYGHNSLADVIALESNIIATGDKNIKEGSAALSKIRRFYKQYH
jgi:hypothetical protein